MALLTPEEIDETRHYNPSFSGIYRTDEVAVAHAQVLKILHELGALDTSVNMIFGERVHKWMNSVKREVFFKETP